MVKMIGDIHDVVDCYLEDNSNELGDLSYLEGVELDKFREPDCSSKIMRILSVERLTPYKVDSTDSLKFRVRVSKNGSKVPNINMTTLVDDMARRARVGLTCSPEFDITDKPEEFDIEITLNHLNLKQGKYKMNFWLCHGDVFSSMNLFDCIYSSLTFEVVGYQKKFITEWARDWGMNYFDGCETRILG